MSGTQTFTDKYLNNTTPTGRANRESVGLVPAELLSMATGIAVVGAVGVLDNVAPGVMKTVSKTLSKIVFEPYLDSFEKGLGKVCKLEECKIDLTKSREERAENLARTTVIFGAAWAASMLVKLKSRQLFNKLLDVGDKPREDKKWWQPWKLTTHEKIIFGMDEGVHYGSLLFFNTTGAKVNDGLLRTSTNILKVAGVPERNARELANMMVIWELPNLLGLVSGIGGVMGIHHGKWDKKLDTLLAGGKKTHVEHVASSTNAVPQPSV